MVEIITGQIDRLFEWVIEDINDLCPKSSLKSPKFSIIHRYKTYEWQLYLRCRLIDRKINFIQYNVILNCFNDLNDKIRLLFRFYDHDTMTFTDYYDWEFEGKRSIEIPKTITMKLNRLFTTRIIIHCNITFLENAQEKLEIREKNKQDDTPDVGRLQILDEYQCLVDEKEFSDVSFTVEGQTIHAHKCILAKSSPVFTAMLQHEMKEKRENAVVIEDVTYEVFKEMLTFMYVGKIRDAIATDLLIAADKYALDKLKRVCELSLHKNLNKINAVDYLNLADQYRADELKSRAIEFIVSDIYSFINDQEFKQQLIKVPEVLWEICRAMAGKM